MTLGVVALLVNIFERKQEARNPFYRVVELTDDTEDPAIWGKNFPLQYDGYRRTVDQVARATAAARRCRARRPTADPRSVVAQSRLEEDPRLKTMWAGYAFAKDFREERGHAYMLDDQTFTERQQVVEAAGHLHALPRVGLRAVQEARRRRPHQGLREDEPDAVRRGAQAGDASRSPASTATTRRRCSCGSRGPAFIEGMRALKASQGVHDYDVNTMATRQEMRAFVCGQCHVEYYFKGPEKRLVYPWAKGLKVDEILAYYDENPHNDWTHADTRRAGAQGAASGVRDVEPGHPRALRRRLRRLPHAVQARGRAEDQRPPRAQPAAQHQQRLPDLPQVAGGGAEGARRDDPGARLRAAQPRDGRAGRADRRPQGGAPGAGASDAELEQPRKLQRRAQFMLDFVEAENSTGFHAPQEAARILAESIDYARQGQLALRR